MTKSSPASSIAGRTAVAGLLLTMLLPADLHAQGVGRVAGRVQDLAGNPLTGVLITIAGMPALEARTDAEGRFALADVPGGDRVISATLEGFAPGTRIVRVVDGETAVVSLTLSIQILEKVLVTADKTGERELQKVPAAVSVLTGEQLQRREAHSVADLAGLVPSVTFSENTGFAQLTIRGIGTNAVFAGSDPSSAVYLDGVYLARPAGVLGDFLDLERVEVLRGPQGTLYGRNVVGGAINLITNLPTNERKLSTRVVLGNFQTLRAEATLSGPIVADRIMASVSALRGVSDGFIEDLDHPAKPLGGTDVTATRGTLRFFFGGRSELRITGDFTHRDPTPLFYPKVLAVKPGFTVDNPPDLHQVRTSTPSESRNVHYGGSAEFMWKPAPSTVLRSLFAARKLDYDVFIDADSTELDLSTSHSHEIHHQVSEELTITSKLPGVTATGGVFLFKDVDRQSTASEFVVARVVNRLNPAVDTKSLAAFGQVRVALGSRLSGTMGVRYSHDDKTMDNFGGSEAGGAAVSSFHYVDSMAATAWTPKVGLDLRIGDGAIAYLSATRGYKSGGFNLTARTASGGFAPEWAWAYEAGFKSSALNDRLKLNGAAFYTDYTDLQVQTPIRPGVVDITNAATATIRGVEVEGQAQAAPGWRAGGHVAWLDARYDRYTAVGPGGSPVDVAGRRLSNAPEWSGRIWLEYARRLGRLGWLLVTLDVIRQSTVYFTPINDTIQRQGPYGLVNANVRVRPRPSWSVGFYARNLTDLDHIVGATGVTLPAIAGLPGARRQFGVQFDLRGVSGSP
jgi:iron complex outermembrane receptor protein